MNATATTLTRLQEWYLSQCDGDWEHSYGVKIETLDNPGWLVSIDLSDTAWEHVTRPWTIVQHTEAGWVQSEVVAGKFIGSAGACNLEEVLNLFLEIVK